MKLPFVCSALAPFAPAYTKDERHYNPLGCVSDRVYRRMCKAAYPNDQFELLDDVKASVALRARRLGDGRGSRYILGCRVFRGRGVVENRTGRIR